MSNAAKKMRNDLKRKQSIARKNRPVSRHRTYAERVTAKQQRYEARTQRPAAGDSKGQPVTPDNTTRSQPATSEATSSVTTDPKAVETPTTEQGAHEQNHEQSQEQGQGRELRFNSAEEEIAYLSELAEHASPGTKAEIEERIKQLQKANNTAKIGTDGDTNEDDPDGKKEGEKFSKGDIIDYLYEKCFLEAVSKGFDHLDAFLLACGKSGGKFLGDSIANIMKGGKELAANYQENAPIRDYRDAIRAVSAMYNKQAEHYAAVRDEQINRLKDAAMLGTILTKATRDALNGGIDLASIEKQYAALKSKKNLSASDKRKLNVLKKILPPDRTKEGIELGPVARSRMLQNNIKAMAREFGPELTDMVIPKENESIESFRSRFSLEKINSAVDNATNVCEIRTKAARAAVAQTMAAYAMESGKDVSSKEKTRDLLKLQMENTAAINAEIERNFGNLTQNGVNEEDMTRINDYISMVGNAACRSASKSAMFLDQNKSLEGRQPDIKKELAAIADIKMPAKEETHQPERKIPDTRKVGFESFAQEYNTQSPIEIEYNEINQKILKQQGKENLKARKQKAQEIKRARIAKEKAAKGSAGSATRAFNQTQRDIREK